MTEHTRKALNTTLDLLQRAIVDKFGIHFEKQTVKQTTHNFYNSGGGTIYTLHFSSVKKKSIDIIHELRQFLMKEIGINYSDKYHRDCQILRIFPRWIDERAKPFPFKQLMKRHGITILGSVIKNPLKDATGYIFHPFPDNEKAEEALNKIFGTRWMWADPTGRKNKKGSYADRLDQWHIHVLEENIKLVDITIQMFVPSYNMSAEREQETLDFYIDIIGKLLLINVDSSTEEGFESWMM